MTEEQQTNDVSADNAQAPVVEEQSVDKGVETRVATEGTQPTDQEINWSRANETMKQQGNLIKELKGELSEFKTARMQQNQEQQPKGYFDDRDKEDIITVGEMENILAKQEQGFQIKQTEMMAHARHPDMDEVINKYGKSLPDSVKMAIMRAPNPHLAAYEAIKNSEAYYKDQMSSSKHENAARAEKNLSKPGSISSVGGSGALSKASYYESISDSDLLAMSDKYIRG